MTSTATVPEITPRAPSCIEWTWASARAHGLRDTPANKARWYREAADDFRERGYATEAARWDAAADSVETGEEA